ncbi:SIMPL domain-containing protein [Aminipila sp.]|uniref:SIMPL domain-containing protein n=1 Tax=Aminipila sp. TaxID=2060095 RepID=UPI0028A0A94F|nr:SIMPL domain-containing protein [Aminipila sp.]
MAQRSSAHNHWKPIMTLTGQGQITAAPDLAVIRLGVETTGYNLAQIQSENAQISQMVIELIQEAGNAEVRTADYSIERISQYENGNQIDKGYSVKHILEITTEDIESTGEIIDMAVRMGANVVESISFGLSDPELFYQKALNLAVDNAIEKSQSISGNLRVRIDPIPVRIVEAGHSPSPLLRFQRDAAATPITPGELTIEAVVTADFIYSS